MEFKTDIEIAQEAKLEHIRDVAAKIGVNEDDLEFYGKYKESFIRLQRPEKSDCKERFVFSDTICLFVHMWFFI